MATAQQAAATILRSFNAGGFVLDCRSEQLESMRCAIAWLSGMSGWDVSALTPESVLEAVLADLKAGAL